ncbi:uncharacterized protein LOC108098759 [Drosophila ficusphila]|uniref:uncharacterized protein LOC108098759 n=1 Tax=Drosophila ficusphila TaxID=30025 RepID=UPI0007E8AEE7|nr:uncharacterized protein LOC108098759 [Drosophila ficusphila]
MKLKYIPFAVWPFLVVISSLYNANALFKFTNVKCKSYNQSFCEFKRCELKIVDRGVVGLFLHVKANQLPINSVTCALSFFRRFSGYRPFLYNITFDVCNFLKNRKRYPFADLVYDGIRNFSNVNHSCPFNHDIIVNRMVLDDNMIVKAPVPNGFYKLQFIVRADGDWRGEVEVHAEVNWGYGN